MAQKFGRLVEEDLNVGVGAVWITAPGGGRLRATQIGIHSFARGVEVTVPERGPTHFWPLSEATGTRADIAGATDLEEIGTVGSVAGVIGDAADFASGHLYNTLGAGEPLTENFTFSVWFKADSGDGSFVQIFHIGGGLLIGLFGNCARVVNEGWSTSHAVQDIVVVDDGNWHHLITWMDTSTDMFLHASIDGGATVSSALPLAGTFSKTENEMFIGYGQDGTGYPLAAQNVGWWMRALDATERAAIWNSGSGIAGLPPPRTYLRQSSQSAHEAAWTPGAIAAGGSVSTTLSVPEATTADFVLASHDKILTSDLRITGNVSAAGTAQVVIHNPTSATVTIAAGTVRVVVFPSIGTSQDPPPVAHFSWTSDSETEVLRVDGVTSTGIIDTYLWDFGDGVGTSTEVAPVYDYGGTPPNNYTVTLTVTGPGGSDDASTEITTGDQIGGSV